MGSKVLSVVVRIDNSRDGDTPRLNGSIGVGVGASVGLHPRRGCAGNVMERPPTARPRTALNECVKVVVRCRPLSEKERLEGYEEVSPAPFPMLLFFILLR